MGLKDLAGCLRVRQWIKNILLFAALVFSETALQPLYIVKTIAAFFLFSLAAGALYIFNDISDIEKDREHPTKRFRPIASGRVGIKTGWAMFAIVTAFSLTVSFIFSISFGFVVLLYMLLQIAYSLYLKKIVIIDVFSISLSFILRVIAGALVIAVPISNWLLICTMLLSLFLALSKRRHEITLLEQNASVHREILKEYSPYLLDQMIGVVTSATLVAYMVFTLSDQTVAKFGKEMIITVPFVLYGIFRYLYLVHQKNAGGDPGELLLNDKSLFLDVAAYCVITLIIIYL